MVRNLYDSLYLGVRVDPPRKLDSTTGHTSVLTPLTIDFLEDDFLHCILCHLKGFCFH